MRLGVLVAMTWLIGFFSGPAAAQIIKSGQTGELDRAGLVQQLANADVVVLGEVHDNPGHHANQAWLVAQLRPGALVAEMLNVVDDPAIKAYLDAGGDRNGIAVVVGWEKSGWPDWAMYAPIFQALPDGAVIAGAGMPRETVRRVMTEPAADLIGDTRLRPVLRRALAPELRAELEAEMVESHCGHLPPEMAPMMVEAQRLRDASLAAAVLRVVEMGAGPVVVITGNGHARRDRGVPAILAEVAASLSVISVGQLETEAGVPNGANAFDVVWLSPPHPRPDPCDELRKRVKSKD